jgi:uracil phosphoribosyltransferase
MAYEISKTLKYSDCVISTPLGIKNSKLIIQQPVLISILRAALPFYQGLLNFFDKADSGFIGALRKEDKINDHIIEIDYLYQVSPNINDRDLILIDPMLATGKSILKSIENLLLTGKPKKIHIVSVIAAPEGIKYIQENLKVPFEFWLCSLDDCLNEKSYIIPGLGDAGDLCFGEKI